MSDNIKVDYKGFEIKFNDGSESWSSSIDGVSFSRQKLADAKKKIDEFIKQESAFTNLHAIIADTYSWRDRPIGSIVTITSVANNGDVWIKDNKGREKIGAHSRHILLKVTDGNKNKLSEINSIMDQIKTLEQTKKRLLGEMETIFLREK